MIISTTSDICRLRESGTLSMSDYILRLVRFLKIVYLLVGEGNMYRSYKQSVIMLSYNAGRAYRWYLQGSSGSSYRQ